VGGGDVVDAPRDDDPDRRLPEVGGVAGIQRPVEGVEADLALDRPSELLP